MNRKTEILIGSLIIIFIMTFFGLKAFESSFDKDMVLGKIDEAIMNKDIDYLMDHIEVEGKSLSQDNIKNIIDELGGISVYNLSEYQEDSDENISIKKQGRERLIFDKYKIVLKPYDLIISSNMDGTSVFIDGQEVGKFQNGEEFIYSGLVPGKHKIKLSYKGEYANLESEEEIMAFKRAYDNRIYLSLELYGKYIYVNSNFEDATLFIDGVDTKINIYNEYKLGPIDENKKMKISARVNIDGEEYESRVISVEDNYNSYFDLFIDYEEPMSEEEITANIEKLIKGYEYDLINSINYYSYSYIDEYIEFGSPFMSSQKKLIDNLNSKGITEDLLSYSIEDITIVSDDIITVNVVENHLIYYMDGMQNEVSNYWKYTVVNIDDRFYIRDIQAAE